MKNGKQGVEEVVPEKGLVKPHGLNQRRVQDDEWEVDDATKHKVLSLFSTVRQKIPDEENECEKIKKVIGNNLFFGVDKALCHFEEDVRDVVQPHD